MQESFNLQQALFLAPFSLFGAVISTLFTLDPTVSKNNRRANVVLLNLVALEKGARTTFLYFSVMVLVGAAVGVILGTPHDVRDAVIAGVAWSSLVPAPYGAYITFLHDGGAKPPPV